MHDVIFKNVRIVDGSGAPWFYGEVAVKDGVISCVDRKVEGRAVRVIDGKDLVLSPGFIDAHSHSDTCWFVDRRGESKIRQGVTTEVTGQCGASPAPMKEKRRAASVSAYTDEGVEITWSSFGEYLSALEKNGVGINVAPLVGHGALRSSAMGYEKRPPTPEEMEEMKALLREALEAGAFGFSSGLIYPPSSFADTAELVELARTMAPYGGIYETHMRDEGTGLLKSVEEAITIGRQGGVPVQISHHKASGEKAWGLVKQSLAMIEEARREGVDVTCDQYPYVASATGLSAIIPAWAHEGGPTALLRRLNDPAIASKLKEEVEATQGPSDGWSKMLVTSVKTEKNRFCEGKRIPEIARIWGIPPVEAAFKLLCEEELEVGYAKFGMCEEDVKTVMAHPCVMIGSDSSCRAIDGPLSTGKPHPRAYGTFARVLGKYTREEKVLTLEQAVFKMTGFPAWRLGLWDRGLVRPGMKADLVLFDPGTIIDKATFEEPAQYAVGVEYVMVNGVMVVEGGQHTGKIAGKVLRRR
ncbi:MAG TPA: D-aminoacylase [Firmicutes bacterium]|nr:D-aminoacylase [Candidatus Fermentithermobacillaceae bacterium]